MDMSSYIIYPSDDNTQKEKQMNAANESKLRIAKGFIEMALSGDTPEVENLCFLFTSEQFAVEQDEYPYDKKLQGIDPTLANFWVVPFEGKPEPIADEEELFVFLGGRGLND
jgi:hypothetical protein